MREVLLTTTDVNNPNGSKIGKVFQMKNPFPIGTNYKFLAGISSPTAWVIDLTWGPDDASTVTLELSTVSTDLWHSLQEVHGWRLL